MAEIASFGVNIDQNTKLAQNAQQTADEANSGVTDLNDPNLMSVIEKQTKASQYAGLTSQYNVILARAKDANISTTTLTTAYTSLNTFMTSILTDTTKASDVDRDTYNSLTDAYNTALSNVQTALSNNINTDIDNMQSSVSVASQAASSATIVASQAAVTGDNANQAASQAASVANDAQSAGNNATSVANGASEAASDAALAGSEATVTANQASSDYTTLSTGVSDGSLIHITAETVIDDAVIGTAEIANGAITNAQIGNEAVGTAQIGDGTITNAKIGSLAVGTAQIADAAITDAQIGDVSADKLTAGTIDFNTIIGENINASNITTGTLDTNRLNVGKLSALSANLGDVTTGSLKGVDIVANTFSTPNGSFTTDASGTITANNMTINGGTLTSPAINAGTINGSDIQAAMIHSTDNSFVLDGDKGSIMGATITSTDNSWSISPTGKITGADVYAGGTYTYVASGSGNTVTGAIYNELNSNGYHQWTDENDHVRINNGTIGITNDEHEKANIDSVDGIPLGVLISDGQSQFTGNVSITNNLQVGNFYTNGGHTINSMDGGAVFLENGVSSGNDMVNFHAGAVFTTGLHTNNLGMNNGHTISSADGGTITMKDSYNGGGNYVNLHVKKLYQSSLLSLKTDIKPIDPHEALTEVVKNDVMGYHFKNDKTTDPKSVSVILDDINPIPKYYTSDVFKSADGTGRNDGTIVGYLMLSIKDLNSRLQKLEGAN